MTSRNLNKTWFEVILAQYRQDYLDDVTFPVKYLLYNSQHKADLFYLVLKPIKPNLFKESLINFNIYTRLRGAPDFQDENLKVWQRVKHPVPTRPSQPQEEVERKQLDEGTSQRSFSIPPRRVEGRSAARTVSSGP